MKSKVFKITINRKEQIFRGGHRYDIEFEISEWSLNDNCEVEFTNKKTYWGPSANLQITFEQLKPGDTITFNFQYEDELVEESLVETAIDWLKRKNNIALNWEKGKIENTQFYTKLISDTEKRYVSYKEQIEQLHKNKNLYQSEDFEWLKTYIKEMKNFEEKLLKSLVKEWTELKMDNGY